MPEVAGGLFFLEPKNMAETDDNLDLGGRRVLVGVTGGIAAYKSVELVRRLIEVGAEVRVVMTQAATQFVTPLPFKLYRAFGWVLICLIQRLRPPWATLSWRAGLTWL